MRLWPASLFGRLSLTLIGVLVAAQLVGLSIQFADRGEVLYRAVGLPLAQRIAEQVAQLDGMPALQRNALVATGAQGWRRVRLAPEPLLSEEAGSGWRGLLLRRLLRRELGESRRFLMTIDDAPEGRPAAIEQPMPHRERGERPWMRHRLGEFGLPPRGALLVRVDVALGDGSHVLFTRVLPRELFASPRPALLGLGVLLLATVIVSLFAVRRLTLPLGRLAGAAERLGRDLNAPPLEEEGALEIREAAAAFNTMQRRLNRLVTDRARILAAISHDLKTPLTRLRLRAESLADTALRERIEHDIDAMERLVETTLDFMRDATGDEPLRLTDIDALLDALQADYEDTGHTVQVQGRTTAPLPVRPGSLRRCLANLVDNALKYAGAATLVIDDTPEQLTVVVRDDGPGIPAEQLEQVFEPFHRVEDSRNRDTGGTGLGLSIARSVARAHGGDLVLANRATGGLDAILRLPR